ncbi:MAG TPA: PBP1A family penicillin-binding protein [Desulfatiglandales bacterium]|nr:PBP1A family penicillin-binding protein [Desulfatiglandales bacterium]
MKRAYSKKPLWKPILAGGILFLVVIGLGVLLYCWHLSVQIEKRFSARRWSIPSKVFSDITLLYPGQTVNPVLFHEKLHRLGYREVTRFTQHEGELRIVGSAVELFLHDLQTPSLRREGFPVRILLSQNQIESIIRLDNGMSLPILELEPEEIMLFFGTEREQRQLISIDQAPRQLIHAVLAAEDGRFYQHHGVDLRGVLRALYTNLRHGTIRQGGSTITQQLAKNYFLTPERTLSRKFKELLMSLTMEVMYEKNEILEIYLNEIYLGNKGSVSINGVGEASYFYFGKPVSDLSLLEAATLAGLIKGPNHYSPYVDNERCRDRRNVVLRAMRQNEWISTQELETILDSPVTTVSPREYGKKAPYFIDYLSEQLTALYPPEMLSDLGFTIFTTLDTQVQMAAERALTKGLARLEDMNPDLKRLEPEKKLQGAVIVIQPKTGYVLAMVGGRDYSVSQFNRITQARRQPGSAFKPFVFLSGLDDFTPADLLSNEPQHYEIDGEIWQPQNYEPVTEERVSLRSALARSINVATVDLAMRVGLDRVVSTAKSFDFSTPIQPYPSVALGAYEVVPLELARAYCVFAADGVLPYPLTLKAVLDEEGKMLERRHMTIKSVVSPAKAFIMSSMLRSAVTEGTARSLKNMGITVPVAGKTGTTNRFRDAWFVGYTPDILALVWVGFDDESSIHAPGSAAAMPIWAELMNSIPQHLSGDWFKTPPGVVKRIVCTESGQLAIPGSCPEQKEEVFLADTAPLDPCPLHKPVGPFKKIIEGVKDLHQNR